jgi:hypothetical protein
VLAIAKTPEFMLLQRRTDGTLELSLLPTYKNRPGSLHSEKPPSYRTNR